MRAARSRSRKTVVQRGRLVLEDSTLDFDLVRMPSRRHTQIWINSSGVLEVRAPWHADLSWAASQLQRHRDWVVDRVCRAAAARCTELVDGQALLFEGASLRLRLHYEPQLDLFENLANKRSKRAAVAIKREGAELVVKSAASIDSNELFERLRRWYLTQARCRLTPRVVRFAQQLGREPARVTIRSQRTRWGSCSSRGAINLNWKLLLLERDLCDYVLAHEACHLVELNHGPNFWHLVSQLIPDLDDRRRRIRAIPADLEPWTNFSSLA